MSVQGQSWSEYVKMRLTAALLKQDKIVIRNVQKQRNVSTGQLLMVFVRKNMSK